MSNIIDKIQLSGTNYDIQDSNATRVVEITQSDYDNLPSSAKTSNILYIITDGSVDYITSAQCQTQIDNSISGKQDTLVSGTNIKTINNESLLGSGNIDIQGGGSSMTIDPTLDSGSTNAVANSAITTAINDRATKNQAVGLYQFGETSGKPYITFKMVNSALSLSSIYYPIINGKGILTNNGTWAGNNLMFSLVETSAITTSITSSSTDVQIPSAKAVNDKLGGLSLVKLTQAQYDALTTKDSNTLYVIVN